MILLITSSARSRECADAIERATNEHIQICPRLAVAARTLRSKECSAVVIDQTLMDADPAATEVVLKQAEAAIPVVVNFAICGLDRVVREVCSALRRRQAERAHAFREVGAHLRGELTEALTGILLSAQLAMEVPGIPAEVQTRLHSLYEFATSIRQRLDPAESPQANSEILMQNREES